MKEGTLLCWLRDDWRGASTYFPVQTGSQLLDLVTQRSQQHIMGQRDHEQSFQRVHV